MDGYKLMKRLLVVLILLIASPAFAWMNVATGAGGGVAGASGSYSCTGGLLFAWPLENLDVTLGTPAGCSLGDTTAAASGAAAINADNAPVFDGTYDGDYPTDADYHTFTVASDDIVNDAAGTLELELKINTYADNAIIWRTQFDTSNKLYLYMNISGGYNRLEFVYTGNGTTQLVNTTNVANIATGSWLTVKCKWSVAGVGGSYLYIEYEGANSETGTTALTSFTSTPTSMVVGNTSTSVSDFAVGLVKVYNSWL